MAPAISPAGSARSFGWAPTDDPGQLGGPDPAAVYSAGRARTASGFAAMGHIVGVNLMTGALSISSVDRAAPYYSGSFSVMRSYDAQEQFAQSDYLRTHPNTDPRPHFFGNWQVDQEAQVSATWDRAYAELLLGSGPTGGSLAYRSGPGFAVHTEDGTAVEQRLRAYGVPGRTLELLGWRFEPGDLLLKSRQGGLSIVSGRYEAETLIDHVEAELWRFMPAMGIGERYTSAYGYQQFVDVDGMRETNVPVVRTLASDAVGHTIGFHPVAAAPPYRTWVLEDGSTRRYRLDLEHYVTYPDGNDPGNSAKAYVVTQLTDESAPLSAPIQYGYDDAGRLVTVDYPGLAGATQRRYSYAYDDRGALVSIADPIGDSLSFEYVEDGFDVDARLLPRLKVTRIVDGDGNQIEYEYEIANSKTRATLTGAAGDTRGVEVDYAEDTADTHQRYVTGQTVSVTLGPSAPQTIRTRSVYSDDGRFLLTQAIDPLAHATRFEYNDYNQMTAVIDALGHRRELIYDVVAAPTTAAPNRYDLVRTFETSVDVAGTPYDIATTFEYARYDPASSSDPADSAQSTHRLSAHTDALGRTTRFDYDDQHDHLPLRPSRITDPLANVSSRSYNDRGAVLSETDAAASTTHWTYDSEGRLLSATDPNGNTHHWLYDPSTGWLITATDALGAAGDPAHSVKLEWNEAGQRSRDTDAVGAKTEYAYYPSKRLRSVTRYDPAARTTSFAFDAVGNLVELTDPAGNTVLVYYDESNRVYEVAQGGGGVPIRFTHDLAGRATEMTDRNGSVTKYEYDALGRLVKLLEPTWPASAPANAGKQIGVSYDPQGKRLRVTDTEALGDHVYRYDPVGNLVQRTDPDASTLLYQYDARNALVRLHDSAGAIDLAFMLDDDGRLLSLTDSAYLDPSRTFTYHRSAGALVDNLYAIDYDASLLSTRFEYDPNRHLTLAEHSLAGAAFASYGYGYRADGLVGSETGTRSAAYAYDDREQLVDEGLNTRDGYDPAGNRLWRGAAPPPAAKQAVFGSHNRLLSDGQGTTFDYDANGNLLTRTAAGGTATTYTYDGANRLRVVDDGSTIVRYGYDADGRITERVTEHGSTTETRQYRYANGSILAQLDAHGDIAVLYTRDDEGRLLRRRSRTALSPVPSTDPHSLFYMHDGLNSVVRLLDWNGNEHLSVSYDAWGAAGNQGPASGDLFRYRGGFEDTKTGLLNFGRRWYDPTLGRWISQDPLLTDLLIAQRDLMSAVPDINNLYIYAGNNPLNRADLTGLGPPDPPEIGFWAKLGASVIGELLAARARARGARPETGVKGTPTQEVQKKWPTKTTKPGATRESTPDLTAVGTAGRSRNFGRIFGTDFVVPTLGVEIIVGVGTTLAAPVATEVGGGVAVAADVEVGVGLWEVVELAILAL
jgi:RHS repeat-associated protein